MIIDDAFDLDQKDYSNKLCFHPGPLTKARGVLNMINVFEHLHDGELLLAGPFDPQELLDQAKNLAGWKKVNYVGKKPFSEIKEYHKKASIGLILFENVAQCYFAYTVKLFEYMYFGTPVLLPNFGDWVLFNETYKCGINVDPENAKEVAEKIEYLNNNPEIKRELGENGRRAVLEELNWSVDEKRLLAFYDSILVES
jgi:glycosyltransferase involved in cell wall biosynthesis